MSNKKEENLEEIKKINETENTERINKKEEKAKADFLIEIKRTANLEQNDQNGYKIIKKYSLKDMV